MAKIKKARKPSQRDKEIKAKRTGYRFKTEGNPLLHKKDGSLNKKGEELYYKKPTADEIEKYKKTNNKYPDSDGLRQIYHERRANRKHSDDNLTKKFGKGGGVGVYENVNIPSLNKSGMVTNVFTENGKEMVAVELLNGKGIKIEASKVEKKYANGGRVYKEGLAYKLERAKHNKSEDWEVPMSKRKKKFDNGGGVSEKSYKDQSKNTKKNLGSTFNYDTWSDYTNDFGNVSVFSIANETNSKFLGDLLEGDFERLLLEGKIIDLNSIDESEQSSIENSAKEHFSDTYLSDKKYKDEVSKYFITINIKDGSKYEKGGGVKQNKAQSESYSKKADKLEKAKPVGMRYTDKLAKKLGKRVREEPTKKDVEKYLGKGVYDEKREDKSDISISNKFEEGGETEPNIELSLDEMKASLGREPKYPYDFIKGKKYVKCFLRPYYKLVD